MPTPSNNSQILIPVCVSTIGSSHLKTGMGCEDYGLVYNDNAAIVFAVADGHGDSSCPRSALGSKNACEIACSLLLTFAKDIHETVSTDALGAPHSWEEELLSNSSSDAILKQLIASIVGSWQDAVLEDFENNPLTKQELDESGSYKTRYENGERLEHIYGTTLIAGLLTTRYLLLLQQGDGRCIVLSEDGTISQPIPWDDSCFANVTTSLCDEDAIASFRHYIQDVSKHPVAACLAGTDGVEDSFYSMEQMHVFYRRLLCDYSCSLSSSLQEHLVEYLPQLSASGSGDDITISGFVNPTAIASIVDKLREDNELAERQSELEQIGSRLISMEGKLEHLRDRFNESEHKADKAATQLQKAWADRQSYLADSELISMSEESFIKRLSKAFQSFILDTMESLNKDSKKALESAQQNMGAAVEQLENAQQEYESYLSEYEMQRKRQSDLESQIQKLKHIDSDMHENDSESALPLNGESTTATIEVRNLSNDEQTDIR